MNWVLGLKIGLNIGLIDLLISKSNLIGKIVYIIIFIKLSLYFLLGLVSKSRGGRLEIIQGTASKFHRGRYQNFTGLVGNFSAY